MFLGYDFFDRLQECRRFFVRLIYFRKCVRIAKSNLCMPQTSLFHDISIFYIAVSPHSECKKLPVEIKAKQQDFLF